jgi:hypothetical protein
MSVLVGEAVADLILSVHEISGFICVWCGHGRCNVYLREVAEMRCRGGVRGCVSVRPLTRRS